MSSIKPIKTLPISSVTLTATGFWPYDEGNYYGEDQWWAGGPAPQPVTFTLEGVISQQDHSSFSTPQLYIYNGLDIRVGDWYVEAATGKALQITSIDSGITDPTYLKCTIEDVDRWEQFSSQDGISATGCDGFIISLDDNGIPVFHNLIVYQSEVWPNIGFIEDVISRFRQRNIKANRVRVNQPNHTFAVGDALILQSNGLFALADSYNASAEAIIGSVTQIGIPGANWFNYEPRGKLESELSPPLPGLPGDVVWLDPANPGKLTAARPNSLAVPVYIKIDDTSGIKLLQGPIEPLNNFEATTNPTVNDDISLGYVYGSQWINTTLNTAWMLLDPSAGAAIWQRLSDTPGPTGPVGPPATGAYFKYEFIATDGQTVFYGDHVPGYTDAYYNGIKLTPSEFDDSNVNYVTLLSPSTAGDPVEIVAWQIASISQLTGPTGPTGNYGPTGPAATGAYVRHEFVAADNQTVFSLPYYVGFVDAYYNGTLLSQDQYVATDGSTVILNNPAVNGDPVVFVAWELTNISQNTGPTGPTGTILGVVFNTIADRNAFTPILGQLVYVLDDGTGLNSSYIAAQVSPSVVWVAINIGPNGNNVGDPNAGNKRFTNTLTTDVVYNSPTSILGNLAANSTVVSVDVTVTTVFDDPAAFITVGTDSDHSKFITDSMTYLDEAATYINGTKQMLNIPVTAKIFIHPNSSTQGAAQITLTYQ